MARIQYEVGQDGAVAAISPNGEKVAIVIWRGDLARNVNVFALTVFDIRRSGSETPAGTEVLTREFSGDPDDQNASPISGVVFLADNRTLAFLGRDGDSIQVYAVDTVTRQVKQLTHHPSSVASFVAGSDGRLLAFSAVAGANDSEYDSRLAGDGVFLWDAELFPTRLASYSAFPLLRPRSARLFRQYFVNSTVQPQLWFDSRQGRPTASVDLSDKRLASSGSSGSLADENVLRSMATLTPDPQNKYVLMFPYAVTEHSMSPERYQYYRQPRMNDFARRVAAPYALVQLDSGRIERLIDAPHPQYDSDDTGAPLWGPEGRFVLVYTLFPDAPEKLPGWADVDVATRKITPLPLPPHWRPVGWMRAGKTLLLAGKDGHFASLRRGPTGWSGFAVLGAVARFNSNWRVATDGKVAIGVRDANLTPPDLISLDLSTQRATTLSNLNPQLRQRQYGAVETLHWRTEHVDDASGFLIKPLHYQPGKRYPLVILLDDNTMLGLGEPFLLDAARQLSGHAIQMLAAQGFMVLYMRTPPLQEIIATREEGARMCEVVEGAVAQLDHAGLIDTRHIGLSGWSRAGYHTNYVLIHSSVDFAAATTIDGGAVEYNEAMRPFTDEELRRIRAPELFESHGITSLVWQAATADRLNALGGAADILYFATASHSTTRPQHRFRSLTTHLDWWRFWLQGYEDSDPSKTQQYQHWEALRNRQERNGGASLKQ